MKKTQVSFDYVDLYGRKNENDNTPSSKLMRGFNMMLRPLRIDGEKRGEKARLFLERKIYEVDKNREKKIAKYFHEKLKGIDLVVVVGGALIKYQYSRDFHNPLSTLIKVAEKLNVSVVFNSVGIENGYDESYQTSLIIKSFLNSNVVKQVTTRDDIDTLKKYVDNENTIIGKTADSASWYKELFNIKETNGEKVIGIGLISPEKYDQYSEESESKAYISIINSFIKLLLEKNIPFQLFTNGHSMDQVFLEELANKHELKDSYIAKRPLKHREIVENMEKYHTIVASRLHACILSYSLNIPVIGLDWNGKLSFFGEAIGYPNRFYKPSQLTDKLIFDMLKTIKDEKYKEAYREKYRMTQIDSIEKTFDYLPCRNKKE